MTGFSDLYHRMMDKIDPRYLVIVNHTILLLSAVMFLDLRRSWEQILLAIVLAVVTELILAKLTSKQEKFDVSDRVLSAVVLALGALILVRSAYWWFYGFIAVVGVISKYLLTNENRRHIYNPTNVAIVFALIVLPDYLSVRPDSFSTHFSSLCCILFFGTIAVLKANSWRITLGYFLGIVLLGLPFAQISGYQYLLVFGPELNVTVVLFAFLMITDPLTSPRTPYFQWIFGFLIAAVNLFLRYQELYYSQFIALFIVISFFTILTRLAPERVSAERAKRL